MLAERSSWRNPRVLSILVLVFLSGAGVGALTMQLGLHERLHRTGPAWKEGGKQIFLQEFKTELALTPKQASEMAEVLDDYSMYYSALQGQLEEVKATGKNRIFQILNDDQRKKFEKMVADLQPSH